MACTSLEDPEPKYPSDRFGPPNYFYKKHIQGEDADGTRALPSKSFSMGWALAKLSSMVASGHSQIKQPIGLAINPFH